MGVLCNNKPKPSLPFAGSYRVIDFSLSNCFNSGIENIGILTSYQRSYLGSYLKRWQPANTVKNKITVLEPKNGPYSGTADAVYQNLPYLSHRDADTVLILAADHVYKMDYRKLIDYHRRVKADVTVAVIPVPWENASQFGTVFTDVDNRITEFMEKPLKPLSNLASMGIYVFDREVLSQRLNEDALLPESAHDFGHVILPKMVKRDRVFAYRFNDYWEDIGTPEAYHRANLDLVRNSPGLKLDGTWPIHTGDDAKAHSKIAEFVKWQDSIISPGCVIKGRVENSVLSAGVWVGENAVVKNSVVLANTSIGRNTVVCNAILDEGVVIGQNCQIGIEGNLNQAGLTTLGQNTKIPSSYDIGPDGALKHIQTKPAERFPVGFIQPQLEPNLV